MLEVDVAKEFDESFSSYQLWKPNNRAAGWPDRAIQLFGSVTIWCELKTTIVRSDGRIMVTNFDQQQAAFMYKWQRANGYCFLLTAVLSQHKQLLAYHIIRPVLYKDWLLVRQTIFDVSPIYTIDGVLQWFRTVYNAPDRRTRSYIRKPKLTENEQGIDIEPS